jgi:hypothetical protein
VSVKLPSPPMVEVMLVPVTETVMLMLRDANCAGPDAPAPMVP